MRTPTFSARVLDAGAALRVPRPTWAPARSAGAGPTRRTALLVLIGVVGLLAVVYLVLRLTPLSAVERVTVVGARGPDAPAIRRAIERASLGQSTLGFAEGAVRRSVAGTTSITGLTIDAKFPHGVQVEVHQRSAVGAIDAGGRRVAVSADGRLLPDWKAGALPLIRGARSGSGSVLGGARSAATILGAAPAELLAHAARVDGGTTVRLADGPALLFRDTHRVNAKWAAAVAVLNDPGTRGATWIDLRVPEQPVAGKGAPPTLPGRRARVGRITPAADALAVAEGTAPAAAAGQTEAAQAAPAATANPAAGTGGNAGAAITRSAPSDGSTQAGTAPPATTGGTAAAPSGTTTGAPAAATTGTATRTGTASTGAAGTAVSGGSTSAAPPAQGTTAPAASGGATAPAGQAQP